MESNGIQWNLLFLVEINERTRNLSDQYKSCRCVSFSALQSVILIQINVLLISCVGNGTYTYEILTEYE